MRLFQYWDTGEPPDDVAACTESVRTMNPELDHRLYDRDQAAWFIGKRVGPREREAFSALAVPSMQGDYFRLCALWAKGGVWLDADLRCTRPLGLMLQRAGDGLLSMSFHSLQMAVLFVGDSHNAFFRAAIELVTRRIEAREEASAVDLTGPNLLNTMWAAIDPPGAHQDEHLVRRPAFVATPEARAVASAYPEAAAAFARLSRRHDLWTQLWVQEIPAAYKATPSDWRRWRGTIYLQAPVHQHADVG